MPDGSIIIDTKVDHSGLEKGLETIKSGVVSAGKMAAEAIAAATAALAAGAVAVTKYGMEYETAMARASTLFDGVDVDIDNLNEKMLSLSSETGMAASQLGAALESALSSGIPVTEDMAESTEFLTQCAHLAVSGFTDVETAVGATAKVLNAYKMDVSETDRLHNILMATQNKGITTVDELSQSLAQVTPTAAAMGVEFEQVGAALATMTAAGTPTAQATTQLNGLFAELGKSGTVASDNLKYAQMSSQVLGKSFKELVAEGFSAKELVKTFGKNFKTSGGQLKDFVKDTTQLNGALDSFEKQGLVSAQSFTDMMQAGVPLNEVLGLMDEYAQKNGVSLLDMFSSIEAGKAALSLAGENAAQYASNLDYMYTSSGLVSTAYDKMMDTLEGQTNKLKESAKNLGIAIYNGASGKLKDVAKLGNAYVDTLQKAFNAGGVKGLVGALGNVLGDVVSQASEFAPQMIDMAVELLDSLVDGIVDNADSIAQGIADSLEAALNGLTRMLPNMLSAGLKIAMKLVEAITENLPTLIPQIIEALVSALVDLVSNIPDLLLLGLKIVNAIAEGIINSIPIVFNGVGEAFKNLFTNADEIAAAYVQQFTGTSEAYETFKQAIADADAKFENAVTDAETKKQLATDLLNLYNELANKDIQTDEDLTLMAGYAAEIAKLYPSLSDYIDPATGLFTANTQAIRDNIEAQSQLALVNAYSDYRDELYSAMADADMELRLHAGELKAAQDQVDALTMKKDDLADFMQYVFNPGIDNNYEGFKNNLTEIYDKITEVTGLENPWGNYFTQLADGTLQLKEGAQWTDAYTEANALLALAISNTSEELDIQNGVLGEHEAQNAEYVQQKEEARQKSLELTGIIAEETQTYNEMAAAAGLATDATTAAGDAAANAGGQASETGQMFELAGKGITNGAADAQAGAEGYQAAANTLEGASETAAGATEGLETASGELATTKDTILATAADIKGAQDAATAAQTAIAEIVKTISTDAATALATMTETAASITLTAQGMMEAIQTAVTDSMDAIANAGADVADALLKAISDILTPAAGDTVANTFLNALKSGFTTRSGGVSSSASTVARSAIGSFSSVLSYGAGSGIGSNVASGIAAGIRNGQSNVISAATAIARAAINSAKKTLGINSPSSVMRDAVGKQISAGVSLGILDEEGSVIGSISKVASDLQSAMLGARMQDAVLQQGEFIRTRAVESGETEPRGGASGGGDNDSPIDYTRLAKAFWQEAPTYFQLQDLDGNYIGEIAEPTVSTIQSRKLKSRKKG